MFTRPEDVENRSGPYTDEQRDKLPYLIGDVEAELGQGRDLAARIASGRTSVELVVRVVCELVNEALRNPLGLRAHSQTTGSFTDHLTYAGDTNAEISLSKRHQRLLGDRVGGTGAAFTVNPAPGARSPR